MGLALFLFIGHWVHFYLNFIGHAGLCHTIPHGHIVDLDDDSMEGEALTLHYRDSLHSANGRCSLTKKYHVLPTILLMV